MLARWPFSQNEDDLVSSGNFLVDNCGSHASTVQALLQQSHRQIYSLISTINRTSEAYEAFFGGFNPIIVQIVYARMAAGRNVSTPFADSVRPRIRCMSPADREVWYICDRGASGSFILNTQYVLLCPSFFEKPSLPSLGLCSHVDVSKNAFVAEPIVTEYAFMVQILTTLYLGQPMLKPSVYDVNQCIALSPWEKVKNPSNYAFYAHSKSP